MSEAPLTSPMRGPFVKGPVTLQVQSILYGNKLIDISRALDSLDRAADLAIFHGICTGVRVLYGDSSPSRCLSEKDFAQLRAGLTALTIDYEFFGANLGSARGHNRLAEKFDADMLLVQNPDVVVSPRLFGLMLEPFARGDVGMVEAKQLPIEHPKDYNMISGETSWATTACALIPKELFGYLGGFDAESFFLYCDDVDFSWRVRLAGLKVVFQPAAVVFHDKRLSDAGRWQPSQAEHYYSAEAALFLAYKWSRPDVVKKTLDYFTAHGDEFQRKAAAEYERRRLAGTLPSPVDPHNRVGEFVAYHYARHRFAL